MDKRKWLKELVYGILAGFCIGLGGTFLLSCKNTAGIVVAALFFTIGLFTICERGYNLFTGKVCYVFDNKPKYLIFLLVVWVGNLLGTMLIAVIERFTKINDAIQPVALDMVNAKMNYGSNFGVALLSLFLLGILCDVFIFIAVNGYAKSKYQMGKYLSLIFGVTCFIVCGTEHSIADMYYWCISGKLYTDFGKSILCLLVITLGNSVGGFFFPVVEKFIGNYKKKEEVKPAEVKEETKEQPVEELDAETKENA
jgi:formate/nitrite transporter FocA (FNT family)